MPLVNFRKKFWFLSFDFRQNFEVRTFSRNQILFKRYPKNFFSQNVHLGPIRWVPKWFSKFGFFIVEICILIWDFGVIFKNYSMRMLSICGNNFIAHWAYEETISSHTEHPPNEFSRMLSASGKFLTVITCTIYAEHTGKWFYRTLSIRGNDLNAGWAYEEMI